MQDVVTQDHQIEEAIKFLALAIVKSGHNPKPVILHSIRVGFALLEYGYGTEIVIAGILHDIIEDSEVTYEEIKEKFGLNIATLVNAVSFNKKIEDKHEKYQDTYKRCNEVGKDAFVILAADFIANLPYYNLSNKEIFDYLIDKLDYYLTISKDCLNNDDIYQDLLVKLHEVIRKRKDIRKSL